MAMLLGWLSFATSDMDACPDPDEHLRCPSCGHFDCRCGPDDTSDPDETGRDADLEDVTP